MTMCDGGGSEDDLSDTEGVLQIEHEQDSEEEDEEYIAVGGDAAKANEDNHEAGGDKDGSSGAAKKSEDAETADSEDRNDSRTEGTGDDKKPKIHLTDRASEMCRVVCRVCKQEMIFDDFNLHSMEEHMETDEGYGEWDYSSKSFHKCGICESVVLFTAHFVELHLRKHRGVSYRQYSSQHIISDDAGISVEDSNSGEDDDDEDNNSAEDEDSVAVDDVVKEKANATDKGGKKNGDPATICIKEEDNGGDGGMSVDDDGDASMASEVSNTSQQQQHQSQQQADDSQSPRALGEEEIVVDNAEMSRELTDDLRDTCRVKCWFCGRHVAIDNILKHAKRTHKIKNKEEYGPYEYTRKVFHRCRICQSVLALSGHNMRCHYNRRHGISVLQYKEQYLDTEQKHVEQPQTLGHPLDNVIIPTISHDFDESSIQAEDHDESQQHDVDDEDKEETDNDTSMTMMMNPMDLLEAVMSDDEEEDNEVVEVDEDAAPGPPWWMMEENSLDDGADGSAASSQMGTGSAADNDAGRTITADYRDVCKAVCKYCKKVVLYQELMTHISKVHNVYTTLNNYGHVDFVTKNYYRCEICRSVMLCVRKRINDHMVRRHKLSYLEYIKKFPIAGAQSAVTTVQQQIELEGNGADGKLVTQSMDDYCRVRCKFCHKNIIYDKLWGHVKAIHGMTAKEEYGPLFIVRKVYHRCAICNSKYLCTRSRISSHVNRRHNISIEEYRNKYILPIQEEVSSSSDLSALQLSLPISLPKSVVIKRVEGPSAIVLPKLQPATITPIFSPSKLPSDLKEKQYSNQLEDLCLVECCLCRKPEKVLFDLFDIHIRKAHSIMDTPVMDQFEFVRRNFHNCGLCKVEIYFSIKELSKHLNSVHSVSFHQYRDLFLTCKDPNYENTLRKFGLYDLTDIKSLKAEATSIEVKPILADNSSSGTVEKDNNLSNTSSSSAFTYSNRMSEMCLIKCKFCNQIVKPKNLVAHIGIHGLNSRDQYGEMTWSQFAYHRCAICDSRIIFTQDYVGNHCRKKHKIKFDDYKTAHLIDDTEDAKIGPTKPNTRPVPPLNPINPQDFQEVIKTEDDIKIEDEVKTEGELVIDEPEEEPYEPLVIGASEAGLAAEDDDDEDEDDDEDNNHIVIEPICELQPAEDDDEDSMNIVIDGDGGEGIEMTQDYDEGEGEAREDDIGDNTLLSDDVNDMCLVRCNFCGKDVLPKSFVPHIRSTHGINNWETQYGAKVYSKKTYHKCKLCQSINLFTRSNVSRHLTKVHKMGFEKYASVYLINFKTTRTGPPPPPPVLPVAAAPQMTHAIVAPSPTSRVANSVPLGDRHFSDDLQEMSQVICKFCQMQMPPKSLLKHVRRNHGIRDRIEYGPIEYCRRTFHCCKICGTELPWTKDNVRDHTMRAHNLGFLEYYATYWSVERPNDSTVNTTNEMEDEDEVKAKSEVVSVKKEDSRLNSESEADPSRSKLRSSLERMGSATIKRLPPVTVKSVFRSSSTAVTSNGIRPSVESEETSAKSADASTKDAANNSGHDAGDNEDDGAELTAEDLNALWGGGGNSEATSEPPEEKKSSAKRPKQNEKDSAERPAKKSRQEKLSPTKHETIDEVKDEILEDEPVEKNSIAKRSSLRSKVKVEAEQSKKRPTEDTSIAANRSRREIVKRKFDDYVSSPPTKAAKTDNNRKSAAGLTETSKQQSSKENASPSSSMSSSPAADRSKKRPVSGGGSVGNRRREMFITSADLANVNSKKLALLRPSDKDRLIDRYGTPSAAAKAAKPVSKESPSSGGSGQHDTSSSSSEVSPTKDGDTSKSNGSKPRICISIRRNLLSSKDSGSSSKHKSSVTEDDIGNRRWYDGNVFTCLQCPAGEKGDNGNQDQDEEDDLQSEPENVGDGTSGFSTRRLARMQRHMRRVHKREPRATFERTQLLWTCLLCSADDIYHEKSAVAEHLKLAHDLSLTDYKEKHLSDEKDHEEDEPTADRPQEDQDERADDESVGEPAGAISKTKVSVVKPKASESLEPRGASKSSPASANSKSKRKKATKSKSGPTPKNKKSRTDANASVKTEVQPTVDASASQDSPASAKQNGGAGPETSIDQRRTSRRQNGSLKHYHLPNFSSTEEEFTWFNGNTFTCNLCSSLTTVHRKIILDHLQSEHSISNNFIDHCTSTNNMTVCLFCTASVYQETSKFQLHLKKHQMDLSDYFQLYMTKLRLLEYLPEAANPS